MTTRWILALVLLLPLHACTKSDQGGADAGKEAEERQTLVRVVHPTRGILNARLEITADVEAFENADIIPRIEGTIVKIYKNEGDEVEAGDVLAEIECEENELRRDAQELSVEQADLSISQADLSLREQRERLAAQAITLDHERKNLERVTGQHQRQVVSDQELETAEYNYKKIKSDTEQIELAIDKLVEDVKAKRLMKKEAENSLAQANLQCHWARLAATISGRITKRHVRVGQKAVPGQPAFSIADFDSLVAIPAIPQKELRLLAVGLPVEIRTTAYPDAAFTGRVEFISPQIDRTAGSVDVRIRIGRTDPPLLPGMFVSGNILTDKREGVLLVPKKGLLFDRDRPYVFVLDRREPGTTRVSKVYMQRGLENSGHIEYLPAEGKPREIDDANEIVIVGVDRLFDGASVRVEGEEPPVAADAAETPAASPEK